MIASLSTSSFRHGDPRPILDEAPLLARVKSDLTFLHVIFEAFRRQYPDQRHEMRAAVAANDFVSIRTLAHSLKGNASTLGGVRVAGIAAELMTAADKPDPASAKDLLGRLDVEVSLFQQAMQTLLNR
jgi:HPt (histidine-containing phosphotransfer) domain-containing protein